MSNRRATVTGSDNNRDGLGLGSADLCERTLRVASLREVDRDDRDAETAPSLLGSFQAQASRGVARVPQDRDPGYGRPHLLENLQPFGRELGRIDIKCQPSDVGSRLGEARNKPCRDWLDADSHYERG